MTPEEFRALGHRVVDWVARYMERVDELPVGAPVEPGQIAAMLPGEAPESPEGWDEILADLDRVVMPGITHWQSPSFFAYFPCNASGASILGELVSAGLGVQGMLWSTSPACTELETVTLDWLAKLIGLPRSFLSATPNAGGVIQGTASEAALVAMLAARSRAGPAAALVAYTSEQAHSSILKAANIIGLPPGALRTIATDTGLRMDPAALAGTISADRAAGLTPFFVAATLGTTSSGAFDPLNEIGPITRSAGCWLHVDAAWAGSAFVCQEFRASMGGVEHADSFSFNPHKWLLTSFDCSAMWTRDVAALTGALTVTPEYLRNRASESGAVIDYRDWQIPLGRRFRAIKLWFVLRSYGAQGLRAHIRGHVALAGLFESWILADNRFELAAARSLALVCFRLADDPSGERTRTLLERVNATGELFCSHTAIPDASGRSRYTIRFAIGAVGTRREHVERAWGVIRETAGSL
jgi:aromatic-L-amino-acid decarboxylase